MRDRPAPISAPAPRSGRPSPLPGPTTTPSPPAAPRGSAAPRPGPPRGRRDQWGAGGPGGGGMAYFPSRSAPRGRVPAEVVTATFYVFHPEMVARAIPDAWRLSSPEKALAARRAVAGSALRRLLGDAADSEAVVEAVALARQATAGSGLTGPTPHAAPPPPPPPQEPHLAPRHAAPPLPAA